MTAELVCAACHCDDHARCPGMVPTGRLVPDTDPYRERTQMVAEFAPCACQVCAEGRG